jgi:hypothetical protein
MTTLESRISAWIINALNPPIQKSKPKENILTDYLIIRYERIIRLRELARKEAYQNVKNGQPFDTYKYEQATHLLREITKRINERPFYNDLNRLNLN